MSFEGYFQALCTKGHLSTIDVYYFEYGEKPRCGCGEEFCWTNTVDTTNGGDEGIIPASEWKKLEIAPEVTETCPTCNHTKIREEVCYRQPNYEELQRIRRWGEEYQDHTYGQELDIHMKAPSGGLRLSKALRTAGLVFSAAEAKRLAVKGEIQVNSVVVRDGNHMLTPGRYEISVGLHNRLIVVG
jgi:ribosomal protein L32